MSEYSIQMRKLFQDKGISYLLLFTKGSEKPTIFNRGMKATK